MIKRATPPTTAAVPAIGAPTVPRKVVAATPCMVANRDPAATLPTAACAAAAADPATTPPDAIKLKYLRHLCEFLFYEKFKLVKLLCNGFLVND